MPVQPFDQFRHAHGMVEFVYVKMSGHCFSCRFKFSGLGQCLLLVFQFYIYAHTFNSSEVQIAHASWLPGLLTEYLHR